MVLIQYLPVYLAGKKDLKKKRKDLADEQPKKKKRKIQQE